MYAAGESIETGEIDSVEREFWLLGEPLEGMWLSHLERELQADGVGVRPTTGREACLASEDNGGEATVRASKDNGGRGDGEGERGKLGEGRG